MGSLTGAKIPLIDFTTDDLNPGSSSWVCVCRDLCSALEEYGFFIAKYDEVSSQLNEAIFDVSKELFHLPTDIKIKNVNSKPFLGYHGQLAARPLYESFGIDYVTDKEQVHEFTNIMWPSGNSHFSETVYSYSKVMKQLHEKVVRMIFDNYGVEKYYESNKEATTYLLRFLKYRAPQENESNKGLLPHTDKSFLTILHQNHVNGLEVKAKNGEWISLDFAPSSTFVVMAGEAIMGWSNDRIDACEHMVTMKFKETRYSLGLFSFIKGIIQVPEELIGEEEHPLKYKPFDHVGMLHFFATAEGRHHQRTLKAYCGL